jgi:hypothetical protein
MYVSGDENDIVFQEDVNNSSDKELETCREVEDQLEENVSDAEVEPEIPVSSNGKGKAVKPKRKAAKRKAPTCPRARGSKKLRQTEEAEEADAAAPRPPRTRLRLVSTSSECLPPKLPSSSHRKQQGSPR